MLEFITLLGGVAAALNATFIFLVAIFKPIRKALVNWIQSQAGGAVVREELKEIKDMMNKQAEKDRLRDSVLQEQARAVKWVLRGNIVDAYERCMKVGCMTPKGRQELIEDHDLYKAMINLCLSIKP